MFRKGYIDPVRTLNHTVEGNPSMAKNLRADMTENEFQRFKATKAELGADTNDEAIIELMDFYESNKDDD